MASLKAAAETASFEQHRGEPAVDSVLEACRFAIPRGSAAAEEGIAQTAVQGQLRMNTVAAESLAEAAGTGQEVHDSLLFADRCSSFPHRQAGQGGSRV